ncbi:hypothetical protein SAMN05444920_14243 [Nonomuraea solani]|uniref:Uncharacterized protein n=1 Tax=Nonomuraea solani TaxID=1144553 RepID=A0A1H6F3V2_9ACTN|nr:hypothetical protein [Nonomuraea solani]SEH03725.1 hypothetical protein SAMN05444920_14243 [Nonomuraea solani]
MAGTIAGLIVAAFLLAHLAGPLVARAGWLRRRPSVAVTVWAGVVAGVNGNAVQQAVMGGLGSALVHDHQPPGRERADDLPVGGEFVREIRLRLGWPSCVIAIIMRNRARTCARPSGVSPLS